MNLIEFEATGVYMYRVTQGGEKVYGFRIPVRVKGTVEVICSAVIYTKGMNDKLDLIKPSIKFFNRENTKFDVPYSKELFQFVEDQVIDYMVFGGVRK